MDNCTIGNRVLIHLSCFSRYSQEYVCPSEMTQDGMALKLGISRAHAALELKRLKERNQVEHRLAHVPKANSRRKVYSLTMAGERMARDLKDAARMKRVRLLDANGGVECTGHDAIRALCSRGLSESEAIIKVLTSEAVSVNGDGGGWHAVSAPDGLVGREQEFARMKRWLHSSGKAVCVLAGVDGVGKTSLARAVFAGVEEPSSWQRVRPLQSVRSLLAGVAECLLSAGKPRLKKMLEMEEMDEREATLVVAEDMAGGLIVLDDSHNSPDVERFASLFLSMNDWPIKVLVIGRRKPAFCQRWSDTFQRPYEDMSLEGLGIESARKLLEKSATAMTEEGLATAHRATQGRPLDLLVLAEFGWRFDLNEVPGIADIILQRLSEEEAATLRLLSILRGPAEPVEMGLTAAQAGLFLRRSLFQVEGRRYLLHESLRNMIAECIGSEEREELSAQAARLEQSRGDIIGAASHLLASGNREMAVGLLVSNVGSLPVRDAHLEMLSLLRAMGEEGRLDTVRGRVLEANGNLDEARLCYERALSNSSGPEAVEMLMLLGGLEMRMALPQDAERRFAAADRISMELRDGIGQARAKQALARVSRLSRAFDASLAHLRDARQLFETSGHQKDAARCDASIGLVHLDSGNPAGAVAGLTRALERLGHGDCDAAYILSNLAQAREETGDPEGALSDYLKAVEVAKGFGQAGIVARSLAGAAECCMALGKSEEVSEHCRRALRIGERLRDNLLLSTVHATLGTLNGKLGMWGRAESHLFKSIELIRRIRSPQSLSTRYRNLAALYGEKGDIRKAKLWATRADRIMEWEGQGTQPSGAETEGGRP